MNGKNEPKAFKTEKERQEAVAAAQKLPRATSQPRKSKATKKSQAEMRSRKRVTAALLTLAEEFQFQGTQGEFVELIRDILMQQPIPTPIDQLFFNSAIVVSGALFHSPGNTLRLDLLWERILVNIADINPKVAVALLDREAQFTAQLKFIAAGWCTGWNEGSPNGITGLLVDESGQLSPLRKPFAEDLEPPEDSKVTGSAESGSIANNFWAPALLGPGFHWRNGKIPYSDGWTLVNVAIEERSREEWNVARQDASWATAFIPKRRAKSE